MKSYAAFLVFAVLVAGAVGFLLGKEDPAGARKQLMELDLDYDEVTFMDRVRNSDAVAVDLFLKAGMNPNLSMPTKMELEPGYPVEFATPLMIAAWKGDRVLADRLLRAGADPGTVVEEDISALTLAVVRNHRAIVEMLATLEQPQELKNTALTIALRQKREGLAKTLLAAGADKALAVKFLDRELQGVAMADMRSIGTAIETFSIDNNYYPRASNIQELSSTLSPSYIRELPQVDPWGSSYQVEATSTEYVLRCFGRNGKLDDAPYGPTTDLDADIIFSNGQYVQWPEGEQD